MVAFIALSHSPAEEAAFEQPWESSHLPSSLIPSWVFVYFPTSPRPATPLEYQLYEGRSLCFVDCLLTQHLE